MSKIAAAPIVENTERLLYISKHGVHNFGANEEAHDWSSSADNKLDYTMTINWPCIVFLEPRYETNLSIPNTMNPTIRLMIQISVC